MLIFPGYFQCFELPSLLWYYCFVWKNGSYNRDSRCDILFNLLPQVAVCRMILPEDDQLDK